MIELEWGRPAREVAAGVPLQRLPQALANMYRSLSFSPAIVSAPGFCWEDLDQWAELTSRALDISARRAKALSTSEPAHSRAVEDIISKAQVNWRCHGYGAALQLQPVAPNGGETYRAAIAPFMDDLTRKSLKIAESLDSSSTLDLSVMKPYPIWKGKGAPFFLTGRDWEFAPHLARIVTARDDTLTEARKLVRSVTDWGGDYYGATYVRFQGRGKPSTRWNFNGQELLYGGEDWWGPKVRKVTGIPFGVNFWTAPVVAFMRECMIAASGGRFAGTLDHSRKYEDWPEIVAADASNFDDSQPLEAIEHWVEHAYVPFANHLRGRGVLSPDWHRRAVACMRYAVSARTIALPCHTRELGRVMHNRGGVLSGLRATSVLDTWLNQAYIRWVCEAKGGLKLETDYEFDAFGDDTIVFGRRGGDKLHALWTEHGRSLGMTYELASEPTFLMKRIPGGEPYPDRLWIRTLNREEKEEPGTVASAALGMVGRLDLLTGEARDHLSSVYKSWFGVNKRLDAALSIALYNPAQVRGYAFSPPLGVLKGDYLSTLLDEEQSGGTPLPTAVQTWLDQNRETVAPAWLKTANAAMALSEGAAIREIRSRASRSLSVANSPYALPEIRRHPKEHRQGKRRRSWHSWDST